MWPATISIKLHPLGTKYSQVLSLTCQTTPSASTRPHFYPGVLLNSVRDEELLILLIVHTVRSAKIWETFCYGSTCWSHEKKNSLKESMQSIFLCRMACLNLFWNDFIEHCSQRMPMWIFDQIFFLKAQAKLLVIIRKLNLDSFALWSHLNNH